MYSICPAGSIKFFKKLNRYLGLYLDYKLNFFDHINTVEIKVAGVGILQSWAPATWNLAKKANYYSKIAAIWQKMQRRCRLSLLK